MVSVKVMLKDDEILEVSHGTTVQDVASSLSHDLKRSIVGAKINGDWVDTSAMITSDVHLEFITADSRDGLHIIRHSTAHLLAQALRRLYGADRIRLGAGPVIDNGFFYDVDLPEPLSSEDLPAIERIMRKIAFENLPVRREEVTREEALALFGEIEDDLKQELVRDIPDGETITIYRQGEFFDLCRGPHVPSTGWLKAFKLVSLGGAYWRGDANNKMLQRIYGTAFRRQIELDEHLRLYDEAKQRDHRKLSKELDLFMFSEDAPGMPFYLPNGVILRNEMEKFERSLQDRTYQEVRTPLVMNERLWRQSGHWNHYKENMYFVPVDDETFALKPMSCPGHMLIYKNRIRSYRDLPLRFAEYGTCHRHELSGALSGLMRVRAFTQDDAHIFVRPDQIESEIAGVMALIDEIYHVFGFTYRVELSTRPENSMGADELWEQAENALQSVLESQGVEYKLNARDGAFYGPKIDFHVKDALNRSWQCGTIQLDFQLPERFDLSYVGKNNEKHRPVVIHRAIFGSMERFLGILTEHFGGAFPLWLSPVQVSIVPVAERHTDACYQLKGQLLGKGIRAEVDDRDEKLSYKIREAEVKKIPYTFVLGDKELASSMVSIRKNGQGDMGQRPQALAIEDLVEEVQEKAL